MASVTVEQVAHLLTIFCTTVNNQQCPVLSPAAFRHQLQAGRVTRHLCHVMCAAAVGLSRHARTQSQGALLGQAFAADAREEMGAAVGSEGLAENDARTQQLLTLSVLSMYETCQGNGLQAWYDSSMFSLPGVFKNKLSRSNHKN